MDKALQYLSIARKGGMAELGIPDATERIYRTVMALRK